MAQNIYEDLVPRSLQYYLGVIETLGDYGDYDEDEEDDDDDVAPKKNNKIKLV